MNRKVAVLSLAVANLCALVAHIAVARQNQNLTDQISSLTRELADSQTKDRLVEASNRLTDERRQELVKEAKARIHELALKMFNKHGDNLMVKFSEATVDQEYWRLFKRLRLSTSDADKLRHLIALSRIEVKLTPTVPSEVARIAGVQFPIVLNAASYEGEIRQLLGDSLYPEFESYTQRVPAIKEATEAGNYLSSSGPLSDAQAEALTDVMQGLPLVKYPPLTAAAAERDAFLEFLDNRNAELLAKSKPHLSAEQLTALKEHLWSVAHAAKARYQVYGH